MHANLNKVIICIWTIYGRGMVVTQVRGAYIVVVTRGINEYRGTVGINKWKWVK